MPVNPMENNTFTIYAHYTINNLKFPNSYDLFTYFNKYIIFNYFDN